MVQMNNYFIIHGSYGNPYKNWIPWLKKQLSKRKLNCIVQKRIEKNGTQEKRSFIPSKLKLKLVLTHILFIRLTLVREASMTLKYLNIHIQTIVKKIQYL